ncbi:MAG: hypothetical protein EKK33_06440 [Bradyrhizobiaceae bacterium]|nr:MAG: hypothetical protein EKK33_06440 [Bradyrhizobiaceae bacterium]
MRSLRDLYPLTRNPRYARIPTSPRRRGEVKRQLNAPRPSSSPRAHLRAAAPRAAPPGTARPA